jgi:hypothetical protein
MLFQLIFSILVILIGYYSKVTENYNLLPLMLIILTIMFIIMGLREFKRTQNLIWFILILCILIYILISVVTGIVNN